VNEQPIEQNHKPQSGRKEGTSIMWWIGYAKAGREFEVVSAIEALGINAWCARKIEAVRVGKKRYPEAQITPYLPNYLFIEATADQWHQVTNIKHLASTLTPVPINGGGLSRFMRERDAAFDERKAMIDAGERLKEYEIGDPFEILSGPLAGHVAKFRQIMETTHDPFPRLQGEVMVMGRGVRVEVDPIDARRVRA